MALPHAFKLTNGRYESLAVEVLGETDAILDLPVAERFTAPVHAKPFKHSDVLRRGVAEILSLISGTAAEGLIIDDLNLVNRARGIVSQLLTSGSSWKRWASLGDLLPHLAEAAPEEFLAAVRKDLESPSPALVELMRQEIGGPLGGAVYHAGLLWALEALEWSPRYTAEVAELLAKLAALDPD